MLHKWRQKNGDLNLNRVLKKNMRVTAYSLQVPHNPLALHLLQKSCCTFFAFSFSFASIVVTAMAAEERSNHLDGEERTVLL